MKTLKIVTKKEADNILVNSLFKPINGKTLNKMVYCTGKYKWSGSQKDYIGKEVFNVSDDVHAIYVQSGKDNEGAFAKMYCVTER